MTKPTDDNTNKPKSRLIKTLNYIDGKYRTDITKDVREGLTASQKYIPCKYFYDARGSKLFEDICCLPEYYPTDTELSILRNIAPKLMETFAHRDIVELGSGASWKIQVLLDAVGKSNHATLRYVPVDISESAIIEAAECLVEKYPGLGILGIVADFTCQLDVLSIDRPIMFCFLGSTIGNFEEGESISFLQNVSRHMKPDDSLLIGFDMVKSRETVEASYNDSQGLTAEFNKNILNVVNNELDADFDSSCFDHRAFFNEIHDRIEIYLRANRNFSVNIKSIGLEIEFREGETINTENSRKFTRAGIEQIASESSLSIRNWYTDPNNWFSIAEMIPDR